MAKSYTRRPVDTTAGMSIDSKPAGVLANHSQRRRLGESGRQKLRTLNS